jgi:hypothetical protein
VWLDKLQKMGVIVKVFNNLEDAVAFHKKALNHMPGGR